MANDVREIMAGIRSDVQNLAKSFDNFKTSNENALNLLSKRVGDLEITQGRQGERVSNLAIFQSAFSIIIGAIASYLGISNK